LQNQKLLTLCHIKGYAKDEANLPNSYYVG
jgi:hypothetical protein